MNSTLEVNRISICGSDDAVEAGYKIQLIISPCTLSWESVELIQQTDLAAEYPEYNISGPGCYIYCKAGYSIYCQNDYEPLAAKFVNWQERQQAKHLYFKAN